MNKQPIINETLLQRLIAVQFPQWKDLPIRSVTPSHMCKENLLS